jgi:hypothetical protein
MYVEQDLTLYHVKISMGKCSTTTMMVAVVCVLYRRLWLGEQACTSGARSPIVGGYVQLKNPIVLEYPNYTIDSADYTHTCYNIRYI